MKEYGWADSVETIDDLLKQKLGDRFDPEYFPGMGGPQPMDHIWEFERDNHSPESLVCWIIDSLKCSRINFDALEMRVSDIGNQELVVLDCIVG